MAEIVLEHVSKRYPGGRKDAARPAAVDDVSLVCPDGAFVVLVGPSGCGKSTTLRMVAGLEDITEGVIRIGDRVVNGVAPKDRDIAMVFQNYALYPHMSVYKNMAFALKLRRMPRAEIDRRVRAAAETLGLTEYLDRKPAALSGGQRQRVAVGRAIVREPKAFLFDEPLSNLDAKLRVTTRAELKALHQRLRTTTLYVTHDQEEAMTLGDIVVVMSRGRIQQAGPPLEVYSRPANRFVAGFLGMPGMNFIEGSLRRESGGLAFVADGRGAGAGASVHVGVASAAAGAFVDKPVVLGVRPQAVSLATDGGPGSIELKVRVVETLGEQVDLVCEPLAAGGAGAAPFVARIASLGLSGHAAPAPGSRVRVRVDPQRIHLFEPGEFGRNLQHSASGTGAS